MSTSPGPAPLQRVPARGWTVLAWSGLALSPVVLHLWLALDGRFDFLPFLAMLLTAGVLRRRPLVALAVLLAEVVTVELVPMPPPEASGLHQFIRDLQTVTVDLAVCYVAASRRLRVSALAAGLALVVQLVVAATTELRPNDFENAFVPYALAVLSVWAIGYAVHQGRRYRRARREQAEIQAERLRIARELHDLIAHSIGVIAFQAGMGSRVIDTQPEEARKALTAIEDTRRDTLAGLREVLGSLREAEPAPGLAGLGDLVTRTLDAGVRVEVRRRGDEQPLPPDVDLAAFRIIQEAVTNVVRHAGVARCVVVMDIRMPGVDGIEATRQITAGTDPPHVLVLTTFDDDEYVYGALRAGAAGFLVKDMALDDILGAIRVVAAGDALIAPSVTRRLIAEFAARPARAPAHRPVHGITDREREVLTLVGLGRSNSEIAAELFVSVATAKAHVARLFTKLDARDRVHLVIIAYELGLVSPRA